MSYLTQRELESSGKLANQVYQQLNCPECGVIGAFAEEALIRKNSANLIGEPSHDSVEVRTPMPPCPPKRVKSQTTPVPVHPEVAF